MHIMFSIAVQFPLKLTFLSFFSNYCLKRQQTNQYVEWSDFVGCYITAYRHRRALLYTCQSVTVSTLVSLRDLFVPFLCFTQFSVC